MDKIAFVFSGQGDQHPGMGADLYEALPEFKRVFDEAEIVRPGTKTQCFTDESGELNRTLNTQPCLFVYECAAAAALDKIGIKADMAAGFSLGELSALCYAGALPFDEMLRLVTERAKIMQDAADKIDTGMAAVLKLDNSKVREICNSLENVYPVNFNCPGQVTVAGVKDGLGELSSKVKEAGGRMVPLKVSGGFHSPFMAEASESFKAILAEKSFGKLSVPVYANVTARPYEGVFETLSGQMASPVLWEDSVRAMIKAGVNVFIELGPGNTLSGMIKRIDKETEAYSLSSCEALDTIKERLAR